MSARAVDHVDPPSDRRYSDMERRDRTTLGLSLIARAFEAHGFRVIRAHGLQSATLLASAGSDEIEIQVRTANTRAGAPYWEQAKLRPRSNLYAGVALLLDGRDPAVYLIPSDAWRDPQPPLSDLQNPGGATPPEWRLNVTHDAPLTRFEVDRQLATIATGRHRL
jgi:hypothetical protein